MHIQLIDYQLVASPIVSFQHQILPGIRPQVEYFIVIPIDFQPNPGLTHTYHIDVAQHLHFHCAVDNA